ncbi:MAG TPA: hypothetical protein VMJ31_05045, partial [Methylocystis sp.]|nr:hypothetical protein [Methylocystis sp.]
MIERVMERAGARDLGAVASQGSTTAERGRVLRRLAFVDVMFRRATLSCALLVLILLGGVILSLIQGSIPAIQAFGLGFVTSQSWNPVTEKFGGGP